TSGPVIQGQEDWPGNRRFQIRGKMLTCAAAVLGWVPAATLCVALEHWHWDPPRAATIRC
ncbi:MAG: hypothetical protein ACPIOQ_46380, partial [Promethearchaeia archaeon]